MDHLCRINHPVKLVFRYEAQLECAFLECEVVVQGIMGDFRGLVVTKDGRECSDQHERAVNVLFNLFQVRLGAFNEELSEVRAPICHDRDGMGDVEDDQRLVNVHFEITTCAAKPDCHVVSHDLHCD